MKFSTKLLWGLFGIILTLILVQIIYSERVTNDLITLKEEESIKTLSSLKTMTEVPVEPFNEIEISGIPVKILKGDKFTVFYGNYMKDLQIKHEKGKLFISSPDNGIIKKPVYIYLPQDPSAINFYHSSFESEVRASFESEIRGFEGKNTQVNCNGGSQNIVTDLCCLNIQQKDNYSRFQIEKRDSLDNEIRSINVNSKKSQIDLDIRNSQTNLDLQLNQSSFEIRYKAANLTNNIKIQGTINSAPYSSSKIYLYKMDNNQKDQTLYCDTFLLDLKGFDSGQSYTVEIPNKIEAKEYSVQKSDNVSITNQQ